MFSMGGKGAPIVLRGVWGRSALRAGGGRGSPCGVRYCSPDGGGGSIVRGGGAELRCRAGDGDPEGVRYGERRGHMALGGQWGGGGGRGTLLPGVGEQAGGLPLFSAGHREGAGRCQGVPVTHRPREGVGRGVPIAPGRGAQPRGDSSRKGGGEGGGTRTGMNEGRGRGKRGERRRAAAQSRGSPRSARPSPNPGPDGARSGTAPPTPPGGTHTRAAQRGAAAGTAAAAVEGPAWPAWGVGSMPVGARGGGAHRHVRGSREQV